MSDSEWEEVTLEELREGDEVRATYVGRWKEYQYLNVYGPARYERKVVKPSPEAMKAAEAVLLYEHGVYDTDELVYIARLIDKAYSEARVVCSRPYIGKPPHCGDKSCFKVHDYG